MNVRLPSVKVEAYEIKIQHIALGIFCLIAILAVLNPSVLDKINQTIQQIVLGLVFTAVFVLFAWAMINAPRKQGGRKVIIIDD